ncbi:hypothetical protein ACFO9E_22115 [Streptomyces maoxianensis]|uniref:Integrase n=1 Tax=Streptomyces maoxianensis TaxID=1459942 RepID=A0ABV9GBQ9_9ACTN
MAPDGRLFRNEAGGYVEAAAYGKTWARARDYVLTPVGRSSLLAKRPYDLRQAGISFWLRPGVDPAECARRAGQSIEVLFRHYAKFLAGIQEHANRLIEQSMQEWDRRGEAAAPGTECRIWSATGPEPLVRSGIEAGGTGLGHIIRAAS